MGKKDLIYDWTQMLLNKYDLFLFDEFLIKEAPGYRWRFTPTTLQFCCNDEWHKNDDMLCQLARESYDIKKIRFKPEKGNIYFYVEWIGEESEPYVTQSNWDGAAIDMYNYLHDNCFRTAEAAKEKEKIICDKIRKEVEQL